MVHRGVLSTVLFATLVGPAEAQVPLRPMSVQPPRGSMTSRIVPNGVDCTAWVSDEVTPDGIPILLEGEVDSPQRLLAPGRRRYPPALERAGQGGEVALRFVVDTLGRPEPCSFSIVMRTDAAFEESAFLMALESLYRPAMHGGRRVPVRVVQWIAFNP